MAEVSCSWIKIGGPRKQTNEYFDMRKPICSLTKCDKFMYDLESTAAAASNDVAASSPRAPIGHGIGNQISTLSHMHPRRQNELVEFEHIAPLPVPVMMKPQY